ncbi:MAG: hypothetical protein M1819_004977 [Sarea resinae]|nr:MAG: hypothetical protein M1819_004977 [Sarea resinae]
MQAAQTPVTVSTQAESSPTLVAEERMETKSQTSEAAKDIVFGSAAGVVGKFIEYPFDTVKVRLQSQFDHHPSAQYNGAIDCFRKSFHQDGFRGLYRGISAPLAGAAIETSSLFFSYRIAQEILQATILPPTSPLPISALVTCGAASGMFTSLLLTPIELIKCKMQVPLSPAGPPGISRRHAPGPLSLIASVYRHHGLAGFWHGQLGTLIRETGGSAAWFGSYEAVSLAFRSLDAEASTSASTSTSPSTTTTINDSPKPLPLYQQMAAGAAAGISYNFMFYPADTIKSCMQTEEVGPLATAMTPPHPPPPGGIQPPRQPPPRRRTFWSVGRAIWHQHGVRGLYRGCAITVARSAPSSAFIFSVYEGLRSAFA